MSKYQFHFTPPKGWTNDPNGLIKINDKYHLFYQHYPHDTKWGPMHWGHAVSTDLTSWEHLPIAITPTETEYAFSGSAILDTENVSGLGKDDSPALLLFYTAHNPKTGEQQQCVAYSTDYVTFARFDGNPVIKNVKSDKNFKPDFRDPKVIKNTVKGGFTMVLAAGKKIEFFHSDNLLSWEYTGDFSFQYDYNVICECPDLIDFGDRYVLTMSLVVPRQGMNEMHMMHYFVGEFNGDAFISTQEFTDCQLLDYGPKNYAAVTFVGTDEPILLGWGEDWNDARNNTEKDVFGKMTLARRLTLKELEDGYFLAQEPIIDKEKYSKNIREITLEEGDQDILDELLSIINDGWELIVNDFVAPRHTDGDCKLTVISENGYYEVFADDGLIAFSVEPIYLED